MAIGIDVCAVARIEALEEKEAFLAKILTEEERRQMGRKKLRSDHLAGLYAAKEAVLKCLGTGISSLGFQDIHIEALASGQPIVRLSPRAQAYRDRLGLGALTLSITHDGGLAVAVACALPTHFGDVRTGLPALHLLPELNASLLRRERTGYKSQYGRVAIIGGSTGMVGAVVMAAQAALRSGAGLVYALVPERIADSVQAKLTEGIVRPIRDEGKGYFTPASLPDLLEATASCDGIGIGPGMGRAPETIACLEDLIGRLPSNLVLDADALYALAQRPSLVDAHQGALILTPHEMEMARLVDCPVEVVRAARVQKANAYAKAHHLILVLKGADTVISNGDLFYINPTGNPGMATAGAGDVLTGMTSGLLAYGYPPLLAARLACYLHGLAGDLAAYHKSQNAMIATDILAEIAPVFCLLESTQADSEGGWAHD